MLSISKLLVPTLLFLLTHQSAHCDQPFRQMARAEAQDLINDFTFKDTIAYFVTQEGIDVFDFTNPASPQKICKLACGAAYKIDVENDLAYVILGGTSGVNVIDISDTSGCVVLSHYATPRTYIDVDVQGNYMFLVARDNGLEVVDISNPSKPVVVDSCFASGSYSQEWMGYHCLSLMDDYAFVGQSEHGVKIYDISQPSAVKEISVIPIDKHVADIVILTDLLVISAMDELFFYDVSDMQNPVKVSSLDGFSMLGCITVDKDRMVVYDDRLVGIDISDPTHPKITGVLDEYSHRLLFHKGYLVSAIKDIKVFGINW